MSLFERFVCLGFDESVSASAFLLQNMEMWLGFDYNDQERSWHQFRI